MCDYAMEKAKFDEEVPGWGQNIIDKKLSSRSWATEMDYQRDKTGGLSFVSTIPTSRAPAAAARLLV
ncbi:hypothetical protein TCAL_16861 [Tigriopus californicus]|uniref:Uncharacterized protein n=1 Tax=Tigriopus californicus TaxID=6832 RepID=A0A553P9N7_TIGCA|nr:hypothetical protein TCAL_16861 [Tigriopus californicus]